MRRFTPNDRRARQGRGRLWLGLCVALGAMLGFGLAGPAAAASASATTAAGDWQDVSTSNYHTCGVKTDGSLWCWGYNAYGSLGDGTEINRSAPVRVGADADWESVSAGGLHTCGLRTDGSLWCWGSNLFGQAGDGSSVEEHLTPVRVGTATDWVSIDTGALHSCGIRGDGSLWCWGDNVYSRSGAPADVPEVPTPTQVGTDTNWESVTAGAIHTCATRTDGTLWCWGGDAYGAVGVGNEPPDDPYETIAVRQPTQVGTDTDWSVQMAGGYHSCGLRVSNALWCWGEGLAGQVGDDATQNRWSPVRVGTETTWRQVTPGYAHTCGIKADTTLWCWGDNLRGSLGLNDTTNRDQPTQVGAATDWESGWSDIAGGRGNTCGIRDGPLWCWGYNSYGQLGNGTTTDQHLPVLIS
jgi:alpha-tubulin suppressor-like RCC1 family protein